MTPVSIPYSVVGSSKGSVSMGGSAVAEGDSGQVSRHRFQVAYFGGAIDDHAMDAEALGPALVAYSRLLRAANAELNKDKTAVRVLVDSEFEHKCFEIKFEVVQTVVKQITDLLDGIGIQNAKDLLKALGVIGTAGATLATGVIGYLKWKNGRKVESIQQVASSPGALVVKVEGNNNTINISPGVYRLSQNKEVLDAIEGTLEPVNDNKETSKIEFREDDKPTAVLTREEVQAVLASASDRGEAPTVKLLEDEKRTVTAVLYTYSPVFDSKALNWRFRYRNKPIYADIRDTTIARDAVARGNSSMDDRYRVRMEVTPPAADGGDPHYKIIEVLEFDPAQEQGRLPLKKPRKSKKAKGRKPAA